MSQKCDRCLHVRYDSLFANDDSNNTCLLCIYQKITDIYRRLLAEANPWELWTDIGGEG